MKGRQKRHPFHHTQTRGPRLFKLVLGGSAARAGFCHSSPLQATYFGSSTSDTRNGLLSISLRVMAHSIYSTLSPFAHRPRFHTHPLSLSLGAYFLSSRTRTFKEKRRLHKLGREDKDASARGTAWSFVGTMMTAPKRLTLSGITYAASTSYSVTSSRSI